MLLLAYLVSVSNLFAQNKFQLEVIINKQYKPTNLKMVSYYPNVTYSSRISDDSTYIFEGNIKNEYEHYVLVIEQNNKSNMFNFFLRKGESKIIITKFTDCDSANDVTYINFPKIKEQNFFQKLKQVLDYEINKNREQISILYKTPKPQRDIIKIDSFGELNRILFKKVLQKKHEFISKFPNSWFSLYFYKNDFLLQRKISSDSLKIMFYKLDSRIRETVYGKEVEIILNNLGASQVDAFLTDVTFYTYQDKKMNISDFRGEKYLLICFWASWCGPCVKGIPTIKELYNKYNKDGLEVLSIAVDDPFDRWKAAMEKYNMPWLQTNCNEKYMPNEDVKKKYSLPHIPQYILIDKQGKILYNKIQIENQETEDYSILKELLKNTFNK